MSESTISTYQPFRMYPDAESARLYFKGRRWSDGPVCPRCDRSDQIFRYSGDFFLRRQDDGSAAYC